MLNRQLTGNVAKAMYLTDCGFIFWLAVNGAVIV
jgi:hypothetical protein